MDETPQLTPKENFYVSLYKDPKAMFRRALLRKLVYIVPSVGLMIAWLITKDPAYAILGYGILLFQTIQNIVLMRIGIRTTSGTLKKLSDKEPQQN
jgi:hypothetical protein